MQVEDMVAELMGEKNNRWHKTVRQAPKKWTSVEWRVVYGFPKQGNLGMAARMDQFINNKFSAQVNPKDRYAISKCKDVRARRVLEFLVPILYLEKPTRIMITVGNIIFGALFGKRPVDWGLVMRNVVQRVFLGWGSPKQPPYAPTSSIFTLPRNAFFWVRRKPTGLQRPSSSTMLNRKRRMNQKHQKTRRARA